MLELQNGIDIDDSVNELYDYLSAFQSMNLGEIVSYFNDLKDANLYSFLENLYERVPYGCFEKPSLFNYSVDSILEGGPFPCIMPSCRERNIFQLAKFASLYADKVLIRFPVYRSFKAAENGRVDRTELAFEIYIVMRLEEVIRAGYIGFTLDEVLLCNDCLQKQLRFENEINTQLNTLWDSLITDFSLKTTCQLKKAHNGHLYAASNKMDDYGADHEIEVGFRQVPKIYTDLFSVKGSCFLTKEEIVAGGLDAILLPLFDDTFRALVNPLLHEGSYITRQPAQLSLIKTINRKEDSSSSSFSSKNQFLLDIPFATDASISSVIELRQANEESFKVFRDTINRGMKEYDSGRDTFDILNTEVIQPQINNLELIVKNSKKKFRTHAGAECFVGTTSLLCAHFGIITLQDVFTLWGIGGAMSLIHNSIDHFQDQDIKGNPMYFLWKLNNSTTKHKQRLC